ncbi:hypothetical protein ADUPG1_011454 [Aduncisulcus paluster]|uniref:Uncharacterized protein n=1 Tax=Aduncisulcus paluster TaxID=2918883 RepID=A0ABQ5JVQ5_9EUKA|nr:hypothetical protein ADUPG1_011454 [Aduncisulcus paluster]
MIEGELGRLNEEGRNPLRFKQKKTLSARTTFRIREALLPMTRELIVPLRSRQSRHHLPEASSDQTPTFEDIETLRAPELLEYMEEDSSDYLHSSRAQGRASRDLLMREARGREAVDTITRGISVHRSRQLRREERRDRETTSTSVQFSFFLFKEWLLINRSPSHFLMISASSTHQQIPSWLPRGVPLFESAW